MPSTLASMTFRSDTRGGAKSSGKDLRREDELGAGVGDRQRRQQTKPALVGAVDLRDVHVVVDRTRHPGGVGVVEAEGERLPAALEDVDQVARQRSPEVGVMVASHVLVEGGRVRGVEAERPAGDTHVGAAAVVERAEGLVGERVRVDVGPADHARARRHVERRQRGGAGLGDDEVVEADPAGTRGIEHHEGDRHDCLGERFDDLLATRGVGGDGVRMSLCRLAVAVDAPQLDAQVARPVAAPAEQVMDDGVACP